MAKSQSSDAPRRLEAISYETALCVIPPVHYCDEVDRLRELYDRGYGRWPPHINLIYPFVAVEHLPQATSLLAAGIPNGHYCVHLNDAGFFSNRQGNTVFASEDTASSDGSLDQLRRAALQALGLSPTPLAFHLTLGQSEDSSLSARDFLLSKAKLLPHVKFKVERLVILVRVQTSAGRDASSNYMRLWETLNVSHNPSRTTWPEKDFWIHDLSPTMSEEQEQRMVSEEELTSDCDPCVYVPARPAATYRYQSDSDSWKAEPSFMSPLPPRPMPNNIAISTYNVLMDSAYPPSADRNPSLLHVILSQTASADVLVLEEVSDGFLTYFLANQSIRERYENCSSGPSSQAEIGPLASLRNVVILSRWPFTWSWLPFQRRHKGAVVACFQDVGIRRGSNFSPLVVAGIHLTSGLTDGAVAAKKIQISILLNYLQREHPDSPWIIAGDFNITTSSCTIELALRDKSITSETKDVISAIEMNLVEAGLLDSWSVARVEANDDSLTSLRPVDSLFEGEEGATFNPQVNALAAESSGTSQNRPQRYDRILVRGLSLLRTSNFNMFGMLENSTLQAGQIPLPEVPSDHFGIRTKFQLLDEAELAGLKILDSHLLPSIETVPLNTNLSGQSLAAALTDHGILPTNMDTIQRKEAFSLIKDIVSGKFDPETSNSLVILELIAVGSYALDVWLPSSDIDCLCIGNISHKTFFKLARQRIKKASHRGVRILRTVEANSGTMLEMVINGIPTDLQYCAATRVAERWSSITQLPHDDSSFDLPILSLRKLKPYRDLDYIQRTLPNPVAFRIAVRAIKLWAIRNGLYASKFGYLGGIHITLMLSQLSKRMAHQGVSFTAEELVGAFFRSFATFNWEKEMVFDPFFHKGQPRYHRTAREPMVILGFHAPYINVASTSTPASLNVLESEFQKAARRISEPTMSWNDFFDIRTGDRSSYMAAHEFLQSFDNFVRIDVQYWGRAISKGKRLVGWLESRCLFLIVDIQKRIPDLIVRIWPARFTAPDATFEHDYQGCYLIGLERKPDRENISAKEARQVAKDAMITILRNFEGQLRSDGKYYDAATSWLGVDLAKRNEVKSLQLDQREWGDPLAEEDDVGSDIDEELETSEKEESGNLVRPFTIRNVAIFDNAIDRKKLRPASDILNRLRWDPSLNLGDYIVGYEDRFIGAKETTAEGWKTEKTDEEYIPLHRVLYFRRKSDGVVVWERKSRIDRIFGSGIGNGEAGEM